MQMTWQSSMKKPHERAFLVQTSSGTEQSHPGATPQRRIRALVSRAHRVADLPRSQVERVVNHVFIELMGSGVGEANP